MVDMSEIESWRITLDPRFDALLPIGLMTMMFAVALALRLEQFAFLRRDPARFLGAAAAQILGLPLLTLALVYALGPAPSIALGMIVVACCPGGNVSNFLTHLGRGETALSVSLTATSSLLAALLTPVSIVVWASLYPPAAALVAAVEVDPWTFVLQTTVLLAVPLAAGMAVAHLVPRFAARIRPGFMAVAFAILILLVVSGLARNPQILLAAGLVLTGIAALHNALAFGLGHLSARALGFDAAGRRALTFEVGVQNAGLALVILLAAFDGIGGAVAMAGIWSVWHLIAGLALVGGFRGLDAWRARAAVRAGAE
ncbi:bile acid transporter [Marinicauda salina]|uniref:Bile acid transporter n=1 Tax=Marinicauda salina TaxID=2135793 RepID=A0A2U2BQT9_9PROT|nr:bile acid:sodium symporter [Marinicauda salina]PWE16373.1 bile acid transporter [Marinicauda salina]